MTEHTQPFDRRTAAANDYRTLLAAGDPISGAELGRRYDMSPQWGRQIAAEVRAESNGHQHGGDSDDEPIAIAATVAGWQRRVTAMAVLVVAGVAAVISYSHMQALASAAGEGRWQATILPLTVDGMMLAASMTALVRKRAGQAVGLLPWCALLLGIAASVAANIASAQPTIEGRLIAAWPPVALLVSLEMLLRQTRIVTADR